MTHILQHAAVPVVFSIVATSNTICQHLTEVVL